MRRRLRTPRLKKSDLWTALAVLGFMALSVPSLKEPAPAGQRTDVIARVRTGSSQAFHKAAEILKISRN